jgi:hypothetical protein
MISTIWNTIQLRALPMRAISKSYVLNHQSCLICVFTFSPCIFAKQATSSMLRCAFVFQSRNSIEYDASILSHGTRCAGAASGEANNGLCGVGVAYNSDIAGRRRSSLLSARVRYPSCVIVRHTRSRWTHNDFTRSTCTNIVRREYTYQECIVGVERVHHRSRRSPLLAVDNVVLGRPTMARQWKRPDHLSMQPWTTLSPMYTRVFRCCHAIVMHESI